MKEGNLVRITKGIHADRIGIITEVREVQLKNPVTSVNYMVLYQGWTSPYPYTKNELEVISE
jgi:hypothetical protein